MVKAHPAHPGTSDQVALAISIALDKCSLPQDIFIHIYGESIETGKALVQHPLTKAVGFTGSLQGGRALFDLAARRNIPIPVFAEMGSVNPVFILPGKLKQDMQSIVNMYAHSITNSAGQFCTNPGLLVAIEDDALNEFEKLLGGKIAHTKLHKMLHKGIADSFLLKRKEALSQKGVILVADAETPAGNNECIPTLASVPASYFLDNPLLHQEIFGSFSLLIKCADKMDMLKVAGIMEGQLTATLLATEEEMKDAAELVEALEGFCGRLIWNGVPTGVEVTTAMHHGGPYPASTDSRFTAVGADGIKRFARHVCFQNWKEDFLPEELRNENKWGLLRCVNASYTREPLE